MILVLFKAYKHSLAVTLVLKLLNLYWALYDSAYDSVHDNACDSVYDSVFW